MQSKHKHELEKEEQRVAEENMHMSLKRKLDKSPHDKREKTSNSSSDAQYTLEKTLELKKLWDINSAQSKLIHYAIGEMIAVDCQPYSIVEDVGFSRLMKLM